jgi:pyruvate formate lyase activating enzyme
MFMTGDGDNISCCLCPNNCEIKTGYFGACGVRGSKNGKAIIPFYGFITALAIDPIEKKPLYQFKPGSKTLSLGFAGCNLRCPFCQNWHISQSTAICGKERQGRWMQPGEIISTALKHDAPSIAYTYSEPLIHAEYILDCMALARKHGIANVLVTNGCINAEAAAEILKLTDAANIDLKSFSAQTYINILNGNICGADILQTVLDFIRLACKMDVHTEITTLIVPELNDSMDELNAAADFIASLGGAVPWHLTAYRPEYRWNAPPTDSGFLLNAAKEMRKKLPFVFTGNI